MNEARGYLTVLHNRNFLALWLAQILSLLALNSTMFVTILLVEKVTGSSTQIAAVIAAFSMPAVFLAAIAGIAVDRVSKKDILVISNALRLLLQLILGLLAGIALSGGPATGVFLILILVDIFVASAVGQFFAPAEGAMIPILVGREALLPANSLFTLTIIGTQVAAIIFIVPLSVKALGVVNAYILLTLFYVGATALVMLLPRDSVASRKDLGMRSIYRRAIREIGEGWQFSIHNRAVLLGILQFGLVTFLIFAVSSILPGYAARVLGLAPEDAIFVFSPAGFGIIVASLFVVRYGQRFSRNTLPVIGTGLMGVSFLAFGLISRLGDGRAEPLLHIHPDWAVSATTLVGAVSIVAGVALAMILIPAQTAVQEEATDEIRGRVLTVQFTLSNALGIPPLLTMSGLADLFGIPDVTTGLGFLLIGIGVLNYYYARAWKTRTPHKAVWQPLPLPGADASTVRDENGQGLDESPLADTQQERSKT